MYMILLLIGSLTMGTYQAKTADQLIESFAIYRLNAPWIIDECLDLSVTEFDKVWREVVQTLTRQERRWFYFCDSEDQFDPDLYWNECLWQCRVFDEWLNRLKIDRLTNRLCLSKNLVIGDISFEKSDETFIPLAIFDYWDSEAAAHHETPIYKQFYAFYIDCLTHIFDEAVQNAQAYGVDSSDQAMKYWEVATTSHEKIEKLVHRLKNSGWYERYHLESNKLQEVLQILEKEVILGVLS